MRTIETLITVTPEGRIIIPGQANLPPGEHRAVLVIEEMPPLANHKTIPPSLRLHAVAWQGISVDTTFRREDIYGDEGR